MPVRERQEIQEVLRKAVRPSGRIEAMKIRGFKGAATAAGIRYRDRPDLGVIFSDVPAVTAGVFTKNTVKAAPVLRALERFGKWPVLTRAVLVNSGNANACTGAEGLEAVDRCCGAVAGALGIPADQVLMCSTGVIGEVLPFDRVEAGIDELSGRLSVEGLSFVARAILTTDTVVKTAEREIGIGGSRVTVWGMAKGAGMIGPVLGLPHATMLAFILTDAAVSPDWLQGRVMEKADLSFNRIIVDGDTSTNDTVLVLANGVAGNLPLDRNHPDSSAFALALGDVFMELSEKLVSDGEGATKTVTLRVKGAGSDFEADLIARAVASSPLVKTAFFGEDPNWGRLLAAAGKTGIGFQPEKVNIHVGPVPLVRGGRAAGPEFEAEAAREMKKRKFVISMDMGMVSGEAEILTCDLSLDYIRINADYRS